MYGRVGVELHVFLTLALDGDNRFASRKQILPHMDSNTVVTLPYRISKLSTPQRQDHHNVLNNTTI